MKNENRFFTLHRCAVFLAMAIGASILAASCELGARRLPTFTVDFCLNGGEGATPAAHTVGIGSAVVIPGHHGIYKSGNIFAGWGTAADGNGNRIAAGPDRADRRHDAVCAMAARFYSRL